MRGSLPSGWTVRRLGEVLSQVERPVRVDQSTTYRMLGVRLYGNGAYVREALAGRQMKASQLFRVEQGDFVYTRLFASKGTFALIGGALDGCHASSEFPCFEINAALVEPQYLRRYFMQPWVWRAIEGQSSGTTSGSRLRFNEKDLLRMRVPFPPLSEQRAIAEALQSADEVIDRSRAVIEQLGRVKTALMQELLTRGLPGRPATEWRPVRLCDVAIVQTGIAKNTKRAAAGVPLVHYLRVANVQDGHLDLTEMKTLRVDEVALRRYGLRKGDVLFTEGGDEDKLGRGCVWSGEFDPCVHQNHVFVARPDASCLLPEFLSLYRQVGEGRHYFLKCAKRTTNLASINATQLAAMPLRLPPLGEQETVCELVATVDARVSAAQAALRATELLRSGLIQELLTGRRRWSGANIAYAGGGD